MGKTKEKATIVPSCDQRLDSQRAGSRPPPSRLTPLGRGSGPGFYNRTRGSSGPVEGERS